MMYGINRARGGDMILAKVQNLKMGIKDAGDVETSCVGIIVIEH